MLYYPIAPLYFIGAVTLRSQFTESILPIVINDLNCTGSEDQISTCPHNAIDLSNCDHRRDASVICQPREGNSNLHISGIILDTCSPNIGF